MIKKLSLPVLFLLLLPLGCKTPLPPNSLSVMELYTRGEKAFEKKKYGEAVDAFKKIKIEFPESNKLSIVRLRTGESYYLDEKYDEAIAEYKEFLDYHAAHKARDLARYRIGICIYKQMLTPDRDQTKTRDALKQFKELVRDMPDSRYVEKSSARIKDCTDRLAKSEYYIGNFYYRTKHYKAAVLRLSKLLKDYPDQKIEPMAISLLAESYWKGEELERALKTYKELLLRYPKSSYAKHADSMLKEYGKEYGIEIEPEKRKTEEK